jgi:hypothetical protein
MSVDQKMQILGTGWVEITPGWDEKLPPYMWQPVGVENGQFRGHIGEMETSIALTVVIVIVVFLAVYAITAMRGH